MNYEQVREIIIENKLLFRQLEGKEIVALVDVGSPQHSLVMPFIYRVSRPFSPLSSSWFWCDLVACSIDKVDTSKINNWAEKNNFRYDWLCPKKTIAFSREEIELGEAVVRLEE
jgi:hypothetical protein